MLDWMRRTAPLAACALALSTQTAPAFQTAQDRIGPAIDTPRIELELRAHEQRMLRDQQEHRLNLQMDRDALRYRPEDLRIPQMDQRCPLELRGSRFISRCDLKR